MQTETPWLNKTARWALTREPSGGCRPLLIIAVDQQRLYLWHDGAVVRQYPVSTALRGTGQQHNSYQTPLGLHRIAAKIGDALPKGTVLRGRQATDTNIYTTSIPATEDCITSRILWLEGLEPGFNQGGNVDSYSRYIYLHGTQAEEYIGQPASHGCIRLHNDAIIDLFTYTPLHSLVLITRP